jgi:hypothetical protein
MSTRRSPFLHFHHIMPPTTTPPTRKQMSQMSEISDAFSAEPFPAFIFLPKKLQPEVTTTMVVVVVVVR